MPTASTDSKLCSSARNRFDTVTMKFLHEAGTELEVNRARLQQKQKQIEAIRAGDKMDDKKKQQHQQRAESVIDGSDSKLESVVQEIEELTEQIRAMQKDLLAVYVSVSNG